MTLDQEAGMRFTVPAALFAGLVMLAGCGGSSSNGVASESAAQIVADARAAATGASAVHITGSLVQNGTPLTLDLHLGATGGSGHMTEKRLGFDLVRIGDRAYIRGSEAFYKAFAGAAAAAILKGRWLVGSATTGQLASLTTLTDIQKFFNGALGSHGTLTKGAETTIDGQKVIAITNNAKGGTLYVATTGKPYPVELQSPSGGEEGTVSFDGWDEAVAIVAPKGAIDVSKLSG